MVSNILLSYHVVVFAGITDMLHTISQCLTIMTFSLSGILATAVKALCFSTHMDAV